MVMHLDDPSMFFIYLKLIKHVLHTHIIGALLFYFQIIYTFLHYLNLFIVITIKKMVNSENGLTSYESNISVLNPYSFLYFNDTVK